MLRLDEVKSINDPIILERPRLTLELHTNHNLDKVGLECQSVWADNKTDQWVISQYEFFRRTSGYETQ